MGILSDPEYGSAKWVKVLKTIHTPLSILCYVSAIAWFALLAHKEFNNETYFSENALLPGLVTNEFNGEHVAKQFYSEFLQELENKYQDKDTMPVPWLFGKMSQLHLEVYTHNFSLKYPFRQGQIFSGINVYGILRAARTPSLEALVLTAPIRSLHSHQKNTAAGVALMLAFAQFARSQKYWAKDIIFLFTEHEQLGMQAWLEAYHGLHSDTETFYTSLGAFWSPGMPRIDFENLMGQFGLKQDHEKCLNPGTLKGRSGAIQAAINLEIHDPKIKYIEVKVEGLNGQLPNLDLVNLVHKLSVKSGIHHSYKNSFSWIRSRSKTEEWFNNLVTMIGMVVTQVSGVPNGNHGLFHRFGIEAVTLEGRDINDPAGIPPKVKSLSSANFYRLGIALESIFRSLNNLLERFHQSYFFYLLAATNRFISIGQYMPSLCLLCAAMLIRALSLWVSIQDDTEEHTDIQTTDKTLKRKNSDSEVLEEGDDEKVITNDEDFSARRRKTKHSEAEEENEHKPKEVSKNKRKRNKHKLEESTMSVVNIGGNYLLVHLVGYAVMNSPMILCYIGTYFKLRSEESIFYGLLTISVVLTIVSPSLPKLLRKSPITKEEMCLVNILLLVEVATLCLTVGMHNFPLGLCLATVYTPVALVVGVVSKKSRYSFPYLKQLFCLCLHPLVAFSFTMILYSAVLFPEESHLAIIKRGRDAAMESIMYSILDSLIYGNWLFNVVVTALLPVWIIFWQILNITIDIHDNNKL